MQTGNKFQPGVIAEKYPQLRKWHLVERHLDVIGPAPQSMMLLEPTNEDHRLLGVYAYRRPEEAETLDAATKYAYVDIYVVVQG